MGCWSSGLRNVSLTLTEFSNRKTLVKMQKPHHGNEHSRLQNLMVRAEREERVEGREEGERDEGEGGKGRHKKEWRKREEKERREGGTERERGREEIKNYYPKF